MSESLGRIKRAALNVVKDEKGKVISFDIDRRYWGRGEGGSSLLDGDGKMCCLGFYSLACGKTFAAIDSRGYPHSIKRKPKQIDWLFKESPFEADGRRDNEYALARINDNNSIRGYDRERKIKRRFARAGVTVNFVN